MLFDVEIQEKIYVRYFEDIVLKCKKMIIFYIDY